MKEPLCLFLESKQDFFLLFLMIVILDNDMYKHVGFFPWFSTLELFMTVSATFFFIPYLFCVNTSENDFHLRLQ